MIFFNFFLKFSAESNLSDKNRTELNLTTLLKD